MITEDIVITVEKVHKKLKWYRKINCLARFILPERERVCINGTLLRMFIPQNCQGLTFLDIGYD